MNLSIIMTHNTTIIIYIKDNKECKNISRNIKQLKETLNCIRIRLKMKYSLKSSKFHIYNKLLEIDRLIIKITLKLIGIKINMKFKLLKINNCLSKISCLKKI